MEGVTLPRSHVPRAAQLAQIRVDAARRRAVELELVWDTWERGGLPGASIPSGSRSANRPHPQLDRPDDEIRRARRAYDFHLAEIAEHLFEMAQLEAIWIPPDEKTEPKRYRKWRDEMSAEARALKSPKAVPCANPYCQRDVERTANDPVRSGRCTPCYAYWKRHLGQKERPAALCEKDVERAAAAAALSPEGTRRAV